MDLTKTCPRDVGKVGDTKMNSYFVIKNCLAEGPKHLINTLWQTTRNLKIRTVKPWKLCDVDVF